MVVLSRRELAGDLGYKNLKPSAFKRMQQCVRIWAKKAAEPYTLKSPKALDSTLIASSGSSAAGKIQSQVGIR